MNAVEIAKDISSGKQEGLFLSEAELLAQAVIDAEEILKFSAIQWEGNTGRKNSGAHKWLSKYANEDRHA